MKRWFFTCFTVFLLLTAVIAFAVISDKEGVVFADGESIIAEAEQTYTYNGNPIEIVYQIAEDSPYTLDDVSISYSGRNGTEYETSTLPPEDVGEYTAEIVLGGEEASVLVTITPIIIESLTYSEVISKVYDGTVTLKNELGEMTPESAKILPAGVLSEDEVLVNIEGASYAGAGAGGQDIILQSPTLSGADSGNYRLANPSELINIRGQILRVDISLRANNVTQFFNAVTLTDAENKSILSYNSVGIEKIPESERTGFVNIIKVETVVTTESEAGNYDITVSAPGEWPNYNIIPTVGIFEIKKADITGVSFVSRSISFDSKEHALLIEGATGGLTVTYTGNKGTEPGYYNATAEIFKTKNYNTLTLNAILTISAVNVTTTEITPTVKIRIKTGSVPPDVSVITANVTDATLLDALNAELSNTEKLVEGVKKVYSIKLQQGAEKFVLKEPVAISLAIPESVTSYKNLRVVSLSDSGTVTKIAEITVDEASKFVTFDGQSEGIYAIIGEAPVVADDDGKINVRALIIIIAAILVVFILLLLGSLKASRKKYRKSRKKHARYA